MESSAADLDVRLRRSPHPLRRPLRFCWRWSWLLTLPFSALLLILAERTTSRYQDFGLRYKIFNDPEHLLYKLGKMEWCHALRNIGLASQGDLHADIDQLRHVALFVAQSNLDRLDSNLPHSGRSYVDAWIRYPEGEVHPVEIRYRGDFSYHWAYYKRSLRVKTKKSRLFLGMRTFNLITPKFESQLNNHLSYKLASLLGLLAPRHELVNLSLNGRNMGLHLLVEQLDESTLRHNRRMPGDLYSGELVARDQYRGLRNSLFIHPRLWRKAAVNNHYPADAYAPIERLARSLVPLQPRGCDDLERLLPPLVWGRFFAFETLLQTFHYLNSHNWRLYYDPARSRFEPVVWDPDGWHPVWLPRPGNSAQSDVLPSHLHDVLLADNDYLLARHQAIESFFEKDLDDAFLRHVDLTIEAALQAVRHDPNMVFAFELLGPRQVESAMREMRRDIARVFADVETSYLGPQRPVDYAATPQGDRLELRLSGRRPATGLRLDYRRPPERPVTATLIYLSGGRSFEIDISGAVSLRGTSLVVDWPLLAKFVPVQSRPAPAKAKSFRIEDGYYRIRIDGLGPRNGLLELFSLHGDSSRRGRKVRSIEPTELLAATDASCPRPVRSAKIWNGSKTIDGQIVIPGDLYIRHGATLRLTAGSSLIVEGRLVASGTPSAPVRFLPAQEGQQPWGAIVLRGAGADGSVLRHCDLRGGSGIKNDFHEYSAMLSIHDVQNVSISECRFRDSQVVDDMLHAIYSSLEIKHSRFENALFDAIDLDISQGTIDGCTFEASGNDALDLMTSEVFVTDTRLLHSVDKGISVGEGATLLAVNNLFAGNQIGVESKDGSAAYIYNSTFAGNALALNAYSKNWRYGSGGTIFLQHSIIEGSGIPAAAAKRSTIHIGDSKTPAETGDSKRVFVDTAPLSLGPLPVWTKSQAAAIDATRQGWSGDGD